LHIALAQLLFTFRENVVEKAVVIYVGWEIVTAQSYCFVSDVTF
jgi:hypothetical protein